jgi:hypothetical protein
MYIFITAFSCLTYDSTVTKDALELNLVAKFIVPDWGDKVDSGIGLSYRPARLYRLTTGVNCIPRSGTMNLAMNFATFALAVIRLNHKARSRPHLAKSYPLFGIGLRKFEEKNANEYLS